jgi:anti-sigma-K factor RskA
MTRHEFSDETLMSYADGALDAETARAVRAAEAEDARVAERIALFRATGAALAQARAARPAEAVPDALMARVQATLDAARAEPEAPAPIPFRRPAAPASASAPPWVPMAMAASLALAIGLGAGWALRPGAEPAAAVGLAALEASGVADALSRLEAGASERVAAGDVTIVASFLTPEGTFCREFEFASPREALVGVACAGEEAWDLRFAAATARPDDDSYAPAGALEALDAWLTGTGAGAPLSAEEEGATLRGLAD